MTGAFEVMSGVQTLDESNVDFVSMAKLATSEMIFSTEFYAYMT
jgi:hypothetical protein